MDSITEAVLKRLESLGVAVTDENTFAITFSIQKAEQTIKNDCNITTIPDGLFCHMVDMACGEYLDAMYATGQLDIENLDLDGALASVAEGDTTVSFDNSTSADVKLIRLISSLKNSGKGDRACYRKIKW